MRAADSLSARTAQELADVQSTAHGQAVAEVGRVQVELQVRNPPRRPVRIQSINSPPVEQRHLLVQRCITPCS
eukprot:989522-Pyramimonas_sp.AAC.1